MKTAISPEEGVMLDAAPPQVLAAIAGRQQEGEGRLIVLQQDRKKKHS